MNEIRAEFLSLKEQDLGLVFLPNGTPTTNTTFINDAIVELRKQADDNIAREEIPGVTTFAHRTYSVSLTDSNENYDVGIYLKMLILGTWEGDLAIAIRTGRPDSRNVAWVHSISEKGKKPEIIKVQEMENAMVFKTFAEADAFLDKWPQFVDLETARITHLLDRGE